MEKIILVLIIVGVTMLAGGAVANSIDLSSGPVAEGQQQILEAQSEVMVSQNETEVNVAAQELQDQQQMDENTLKTRVTMWKIIYWVCAIVGGLALTICLIMVAVNIAAAMSISNIRFISKAIPVRSGEQVGWTLPIIPGVVYLTNDNSPQVIAMLTAQGVSIHEPRDPVGLALAGVLRQRAFADTSRDKSERTIELMTTLIAALNGVPRLTAAQVVDDE